MNHMVIQLVLSHCTPQDVCRLSMVNNMTKEVVEDVIPDWFGYLFDNGSVTLCCFCHRMTTFVYECHRCGLEACDDCEGEHMHCEVNDVNTCYNCVSYYYY